MTNFDLYRPRVLVLCCSAGGSSEGYRRAGFIPTGIDIVRQPRYPYQFIRADAFEFAARYGQDYDLIHASPPCQGYSVLNNMRSKKYPMLIGQMRDLLIEIGRPYIIENVERARRYMRHPIMLCGADFGLKTYRHRLFESNLFLSAPVHQPHEDKSPPAGRGLSPKGYATISGTGGITGLEVPYMQFAAKAMGISWMSRTEISQAIPPVYTEFIGRQIMSHIESHALADARPTLF